MFKFVKGKLLFHNLHIFHNLCIITVRFLIYFSRISYIFDTAVIYRGRIIIVRCLQKKISILRKRYGLRSNNTKFTTQFLDKSKDIQNRNNLCKTEMSFIYTMEVTIYLFLFEKYNYSVFKNSQIKVLRLTLNQ